MDSRTNGDPACARSTRYASIPIHHYNGAAARRIDFDIEKETP
jgi:hypothetical protein